uniref:Copper transport protein n=1 Tax=Panagrellus redivivus TaxID=6233 RepID=A0A7E4UMZ6_PANRE
MDHHHDHGHDAHAGHDMGANLTTPSPVAMLASTAATAIVKAIENVTQAVVTAQTTAAPVLSSAAPHLAHDAHGHHDHAGHGSHAVHDHHHAAEVAAAAAGHDHGAHAHGEHMMKMYFHFGFKEVILFNFWEIDSFFGMLLSFIVIFALGALYEGLKTVRIYLQIKEAKRMKKRAHRGNHSVSMSQVEDTSEKTCLPTHSHHNNTSQSLLGNGEGVVYAPTVAVHDDADDANLTFLDFLKGSTKRTTPLFDQFRLLQAGLYCIQITLAYMLMLVAMTYNVYLTAAVVLGAGFGHWLFAVLQSTLSELASDACH